MLIEGLKTVDAHRKKWIHIYEYLLVCINTNKFTRNNKLPSEPFLVQKFGVSRETVRFAMQRLREEGRIYSVRGSGTFFDRTVALAEEAQAATGKVHIGFITQGHDYNASSNLVRGIQHALDKDSVDLKIFLTDNKFANERTCLESCYAGFDGLIVDGVKASLVSPNLDCYAKINQKNIPLIFFNNYYTEAPYPVVSIDEEGCADGLVRRLTAAGHKHIAGIFIYDNALGQEKYSGFMKSIIKHKAVFKDEYIKWCISDESYDKKNFPKRLWKFLKGLPKVTAIVCCNYLVLEMVLALFKEKGVRVPEDYSIVGFDYSSLDWKERGITASIHPGYAMGQRVGENILRMVEDQNFRKHDYSYIFSPHIHDGTSILKLV